MALNRTIAASFRAMAPDGIEYEIHTFQTVCSDSGRPEDEKPIGMRRLLTRDGRPVVEIASDEFEIRGGCSNKPIRVKSAAR
jgi:hypothetical protein